MRRKDREIKDFDKIVEIINRCKILRLGIADGKYPYIVPVNFCFETNGEKIDFIIHGAMDGKKYNLLKESRCCSFEMDLAHEIQVNGKKVTQIYESVMREAEAVFIEDEDEKLRLINELTGRYTEDKDLITDKRVTKRTAVIRLSVKTITGKSNRK